jgi:hypothetical protein
MTEVTKKLDTLMNMLELVSANQTKILAGQDEIKKEFRKRADISMVIKEGGTETKRTITSTSTDRPITKTITTYFKHVYFSDKQLLFDKKIIDEEIVEKVILEKKNTIDSKKTLEDRERITAHHIWPRLSKEAQASFRAHKRDMEAQYSAANAENLDDPNTK